MSCYQSVLFFFPLRQSLSPCQVIIKCSAIILLLFHHWTTSWQHSMAWFVTWGDFLRMECWRQTFFLWEEELVQDPPASDKKSSEVPGHWESEAVVACPGSDWSSAAYAGPRHYKWHGLSGSWLSCSGGAPPSLVLPDHAVLQDKQESQEENFILNVTFLLSRLSVSG